MGPHEQADAQKGAMLRQLGGTVLAPSDAFPSAAITSATMQAAKRMSFLVMFRSVSLKEASKG